MKRVIMTSKQAREEMGISKEKANNLLHKVQVEILTAVLAGKHACYIEEEFNEDVIDYLETGEYIFWKAGEHCQSLDRGWFVRW